MLRPILPLLAAAAFVASAQKYDGPVPPKPDIPYLKHASELVPTESVQATEEKKKDDITYVIAGPSSSAKTPLASPIFLLKSDKLSPDRLGLYRLDVRNGRREIVFGAKKKPKPILIEVNRVAPGLYRIEVDESLESGEYALSPEGSNQSFCFQVF